MFQKCYKKIGLHLLCIFLFLSLTNKSAKAAGNWFLSAYSAVLTRAPIEKTLSRPSDIDESYKLFALACGRKIGQLTKHIDFEAEGQIVKHFGSQHHMEFNALIAARWLTFPWNHHVTTSFAIGEGLSLATETPRFERDLHEGNASHFLNYLVFELSFSLPHLPHWELIARNHHRSGVGGIFDGVHGGSNALGLGIKYKF